ncbi:MAG TPA: MiaB/RimO family radical SAM methylthiotransferase [Gemmatimonadaceae bacterium]|nr:MiaB/RimO family radical SAM methylthiotransferase [Gemmatimonadaceae bacterium]
MPPRSAASADEHPALRVYLATFGCRANQADSETLRAALRAAGAQVVADVESADAAVFNSCAVTSAAEADLRRAVRRAARRRPELRTVVTGCAAALDRGVLAALPTVRAVIAGADPTRVATALELPQAMSRATVRDAQTGTRALLRIQDGCDAHCTFCATTHARGASRSRPVAALVEDARAFARWHPEIVLTGIHIGSYGRDIGTTLSSLVLQLIRHVPDVRFRLTSIEATEVDDALVELLAAEPRRLAPHLHAPLQSGSDRVLRRMGRHWYTAARYAGAIERLARRLPRLGLGADVIAGFPGETEDDHRATMSLVRDLPFTYLHVFPYSVRPGTAAERLPAQVPAAERARRAAELRAIGEARGHAYRRTRDGEAADVVVLGGGPEREGLTGDYLTVGVSGTWARGDRFEARLSLGEDGRLCARAAARCVPEAVVAMGGTSTGDAHGQPC